MAEKIKDVINTANGVPIFFARTGRRMPLKSISSAIGAKTTASKTRKIKFHREAGVENTKITSCSPASLPRRNKTILIIIESPITIGRLIAYVIIALPKFVIIFSVVMPNASLKCHPCLRQKKYINTIEKMWNKIPCSDANRAIVSPET